MAKPTIVEGEPGVGGCGVVSAPTTYRNRPPGAAYDAYGSAPAVTGNGEPGISVNAPVRTSMAKPDTSRENLLITYRNRPVGAWHVTTTSTGAPTTPLPSSTLQVCEGPDGCAAIDTS